LGKGRPGGISGKAVSNFEIITIFVISYAMIK
jgi:hypothetical protein